ncbi:uncharacterized protein LOC131996043 [Stomoxys calcitrans]|uniref:uncharacterized protein LOC131996043 n=1 Tax=Stomoxys calcitrans TaxID=35570 RepID=UPI0027E2805E|nr:uncharacterized protein LOC131996043 [Stomoxys calcitrans]
MPVENSPPRSSAQAAAAVPSSNNQATCRICKESMIESEECFTISGCLHTFHKLCIESHLSSSGECPVCKRICQPVRDKEIATRDTSRKTNPSRGKGRGAMSHQYNTRSTVRDFFQSHIDNFQDNNACSQEHRQVASDANDVSRVQDNSLLSPQPPTDGNGNGCSEMQVYIQDRLKVPMV